MPRTTTYEVLSGLKEGERVVTSGQFMLDSESQLREAIQKMLNPNASSNTGGGHPARNWPLRSSAAARSQESAPTDRLRVPDARACYDQIQPSREMPDLRNDAYSRVER